MSVSGARSERLWVQTVLGRVAADGLGHIQPHEHVMLEAGPAAVRHPALRIDDIERTERELLLYRNAGGTGIVDAQPLGSGRMAAELVRLAQRTGVQIIASTGFHKAMFYGPDHWIRDCPPERLYRLFAAELTEGMLSGNGSRLPEERIPAKAGIVKAAVDADGLTAYYAGKLEAAAAAAAETGVAVMVHIEAGSDPLAVVDFLTGCGVTPERIILCHLDRTHHDYKLHENIAQAGVYLEYDTIGRFKYHDDMTEARLIAHMVERGYEASLLLSLDTTRERLRSYGGELGLNYLLDTFLPLLRRAGMRDETIERMTIVNPRQALAVRQ